MSKYEVTYPDNCIKVLDKGFVKLIEVMGNDYSVTQAARVSYGPGTKSLQEDEGLIRYLLRHRHTTPFEMVEFKFHCRMPVFVARQWIRHRTANVNEISGRYSEMPDYFYEPNPDDITAQSKTNKQGGSTQALSGNETLASEFKDSQKKIYEEYEKYLELGMRRELARVNLPLSLYTEWYWKIDLHNLLHFLKLRLDAHAQYEIRVFAQAMAEIVKEKVPICWQAFCDYQLNSAEFSGKEMQVFKKILNKEEFVLSEIIPNKREAKEFIEKLERFGLPLP